MYLLPAGVMGTTEYSHGWCGSEMQFNSNQFRSSQGRVLQGNVQVNNSIPFTVFIHPTKDLDCSRTLLLNPKVLWPLARTSSTLESSSITFAAKNTRTAIPMGDIQTAADTTATFARSLCQSRDCIRSFGAYSSMKHPAGARNARGTSDEISGRSPVMSIHNEMKILVNFLYNIPNQAGWRNEREPRNEIRRD